MDHIDLEKLELRAILVNSIEEQLLDDVIPSVQNWCHDYAIVLADRKMEAEDGSRSIPPPATGS